MHTEAFKYRLATGVELIFATWDGEDASVVLNVDAGDTLLASMEAVAVLQSLQQKDMSSAELLDRLYHDSKSGEDPEADSELMLQLLAGLGQQGLVERADA